MEKRTAKKKSQRTMAYWTTTLTWTTRTETQMLKAALTSLWNFEQWYHRHRHSLVIQRSLYETRFVVKLCTVIETSPPRLQTNRIRCSAIFEYLTCFKSNRTNVHLLLFVVTVDHANTEQWSTHWSDRHRYYSFLKSIFVAEPSPTLFCHLFTWHIIAINSSRI